MSNSLPAFVMLLRFERVPFLQGFLAIKGPLQLTVSPSKFSFLFTVRDEDRSTTEKSSHFDFALSDTGRVCYITHDSCLSLTSAFPDTPFQTRFIGFIFLERCDIYRKIEQKVRRSHMLANPTLPTLPLLTSCIRVVRLLQLMNQC